MTPTSELDRLFGEVLASIPKPVAPDNYNPVPDAPVPIEDEHENEV